EYLRSKLLELQEEMQRRLREYRGDRPPLQLAGRTVVLVDDGLATGSTALSAARSIRSGSPAAVILAVPVSPPEVVSRLSQEVDRMVARSTPSDFHAVGQFYDNFEQVTDSE